MAHNHPLLPKAFSDILLSDELREYVQERHRIRVTLLKIQMALEARRVRLLSAQIHRICKPGHIEAFGDSSAALMSLMRDVHGNIAECEESFHQSRVRVAVFTQTPEENAILAEFGDVVEIDGTDYQVLLKSLRKKAIKYQLGFGVKMPTCEVVKSGSPVPRCDFLSISRHRISGRIDFPGFKIDMLSRSTI
jgi:hypothetical protein